MMKRFASQTGGEDSGGATPTGDMARVAGGAARSLGEMRRQMRAQMRDRLEGLLERAALVSRSEFELVEAMASRARAEQEAMATRVTALEERLAAMEARLAKLEPAPKRARKSATASASARGRQATGSRRGGRKKAAPPVDKDDS